MISAVPEKIRLEVKNMTIDNDSVWNAIAAGEGKKFRTHRGKEFSYHIKTNKYGEQLGAIVIDTNRMEITRATVLLALHRAVELQEKKGFIKNPGKLGAYGAAYLLPVFEELGICTSDPEKQPEYTFQDQTVQEKTEINEEDRRSEQNLCVHCGYPLKEEFEFCPKCGRRLGNGV